MGSTQLKKDFRLNWAKKLRDSKIKIVKTKEEAVLQKFTECGKYMSLDRIVIIEGGWQNPRAVTRALNYVSEAVKNGPPFVKWHNWKKTTEILFVEEEHMHSFERAWRRRRDETVEMDGDAEVDEDASATVPGAEKSSAGSSTSVARQGQSDGNAAGQPPTKRRRTTPVKVETSGANNQRKVKEELPEEGACEKRRAKEEKARKAKLQKQAEALKAACQKVIAAQASIEHSIDKDEKYQWAKNASWQQKALDDAKKKVENFVASNLFNRFFISNDMAICKQRFGQDLSSHFESFLQGEPNVTAMEKAHVKFNKHHMVNEED